MNLFNILFIVIILILFISTTVINYSSRIVSSTPVTTQLDHTPKGWWGKAFRLIFRTSYDAINGFFKLTQQFQKYSSPYDTPVVATVRQIAFLFCLFISVVSALEQTL